MSAKPFNNFLARLVEWHTKRSLLIYISSFSQNLGKRKGQPLKSCQSGKSAVPSSRKRVGTRVGQAQGFSIRDLSPLW